MHLFKMINYNSNQRKNNLMQNKIFYRYKNPLHTLNDNEIYDLNIRELIEVIMTENEYEVKDKNNKNENDLREFITQNIKGDYTLKIMALSNNDSTRNLYIKKFFWNI